MQVRVRQVALAAIRMNPVGTMRGGGPLAGCPHVILISALRMPEADHPTSAYLGLHERLTCLTSWQLTEHASTHGLSVLCCPAALVYEIWAALAQLPYTDRFCLYSDLKVALGRLCLTA